MSAEVAAGVEELESELAAAGAADEALASEPATAVACTRCAAPALRWRARCHQPLNLRLQLRDLAAQLLNLFFTRSLGRWIRLRRVVGWLRALSKG